MRIMIADDHSLVRLGLRQIVSMRRGWSVAAEATRADEVLPLLRQQRVDLLILEVSLGRRSGIDLLSSVRAEFPSLPVLMLSIYAEEQYAVRCLRAGASGYIEKDASPDELITAIERVAAGRTYISEEIGEQLATNVVRGNELAPHDRLSTREFEVFRLIGGGQSVSDIAQHLHLSVKTVSTYRARIMEKTGFHSNADIIAYVIRNGLL
jgi:two-component system, NarL family, invasion response regulator UvrY